MDYYDHNYSNSEEGYGFMKHLHVGIDDDNHNWLNKIRREILLENGENIPLSKMMILSLIELRKNNNTQEIKNKLVYYKRLGKIELKGIISDLGDD